jgi:hypothetical protein
MAAALFVLALPLVTFVSLALLPAGRPALIGIVVAILAVLLIGPRVAPEDGSGFGSLFLWIFGGAIAMAALAQGLRLLGGAEGGIAPYPVVVGLVFLGAALPVALLLGLT